MRVLLQAKGTISLHTWHCGSSCRNLHERFCFCFCFLRPAQRAAAHLPNRSTQVAYNAERRRQFWEQTSRDDKKELDELRAIVRDEEEKAEARRRDAYARGAEVGAASMHEYVQLNGCRFSCRSVGHRRQRDQKMRKKHVSRLKTSF